MNILLLGSHGQVGSAWTELSRAQEWPKGFQLIAWDRIQADLSQPERLVESIEALHATTPLSVIINAAAYTQVDQAENDRKNCRFINALSPANIADFCFDHQITLLTYSSDYVYSGEGHFPHHEEEVCAPLNYYGLTKAEGDASIEESGAKHLIFRTSWVYSFAGKNFVSTMLKLGKGCEQLKVVSDQMGAPTYAPELVRNSLLALKKALVLETVSGEFPSGVYHLCNSGVTSWHGFAEEIFKQARESGVALQVKEVLPILSVEYPTPAKRPANSRLSLDKFESTFQIHPRSWQESLSECMKRIQRTTS